MTQFTDVSIGTSEPVDLCVGLPMLPVGSIRAGFQSSQHADPIYDTSATVLFSRFKLSSYYEFQIGMCGPSVAFLLENVGVTLTNGTSQGQLALDLSKSKQEMDSGLFMGFTFGGGVHAIEQLYLPSSWYSPWKFTWHTVFDASIKVDIDFVELFSELIAYLIEQGGEDDLWSEDTAKHLAPLAETGKTFEFTGETLDVLPKQTSLSAEPSLTIPVNLVDYVPPLASFVKLLHKVKGDLIFGPTFTIGMPVTLSLDSFTVDKGLTTQATYGSLQYGSTSVTATGPLNSSTPKTLTTNVKYDVGFEIDLGVCFTLSACKIFSFDFQALSLDLLALLGFPSIPTTSSSGSVTTVVESPSLSCVLVPELTLQFPDPVAAGSAVTGTVRRR